VNPDYERKIGPCFGKIEIESKRGFTDDGILHILVSGCRGLSQQG
jgi:hypothetical protein